MGSGPEDHDNTLFCLKWPSGCSHWPDEITVVIIQKHSRTILVKHTT